MTGDLETLMVVCACAFFTAVFGMVFYAVLLVDMERDCVQGRPIKLVGKTFKCSEVK